MEAKWVRLENQMQQLMDKDAIQETLLSEAHEEIQRLNQKVFYLEQLLNNDRSLATSPPLLKSRSGNKKQMFMARSCYEALSIDPTLSSGNYYIDPDGTNIGNAPIYVYCDMTTGNEHFSLSISMFMVLIL